MKKALVKDIFVAILVLGVIALVAGGLLGLVNSFTKITAEEEMKRLTDKIAESGVYDGEEALTVLNLEGISKSYDNGSVINVFNAGATYVVHCSGTGGYSNNSFEILVNITDGQIKKIAPYTHGETPGVGTRAFKDDMLEQFYKKDLDEVKKIVGIKSSVKKSDPVDPEVAMVTGASKSSTALINAVNIAIDWYLDYQK